MLVCHTISGTLAGMTHMPDEQDGSSEIELEQPAESVALDIGDDDADALAGDVAVFDDDPAILEAADDDE